MLFDARRRRQIVGTRAARGCAGDERRKVRCWAPLFLFCCRVCAWSLFSSSSYRSGARLCRRRQAATDVAMLRVSACQYAQSTTASTEAASTLTWPPPCLWVEPSFDFVSLSCCRAPRVFCGRASTSLYI
jgi:hypothetical protein